MTLFFEIAALLFGTIFGSFLNVVIYRVPKRESIVWPGSHCPRCSHPLEWWENVPLVSYLGLRGRCRSCKQPIHWRYPLVEAATGLLVWLIYHFEGFGVRGLALTVFALLLMAIFWIDIDEMLILDVMTLPGIALGLLFSFWNGMFWQAFFAALFGYAFFAAIYYLSLLLLKKEGMGQGDWKLAAMLGAWLGPWGLMIALYVSFLVGSLVGVVLWIRRGKSDYFPFGPAMVIGGWLSLFTGTSLVHWYLALF